MTSLVIENKTQGAAFMREVCGKRYEDLQLYQQLVLRGSMKNFILWGFVSLPQNVKSNLWEQAKNEAKESEQIGTYSILIFKQWQLSQK